MMRDDNLSKMIPEGEFYNKRAKNIGEAIDKEIIHSQGEIASIAFINKIVGLKFVTWITNEKYQRKGYATKCITKIKKRHRLLFAKVQKDNITSYNFAIKNGFKKICDVPKMFFVLPGTLFYWKPSST